MNITSTLDWLTDWYFRPKRFETTRLYENLGIKIFYYIVPTCGYLVGRYIIRKMVVLPPGYAKGMLRTNERYSRLFEAIHAPFVLFFGACAYIELRHGHLWQLYTSLVFLLLLGIYPVMLQRWKRIRFYRLIKHFEKKNS